MNIKECIEEKYKKGNMLLFSRDSQCLKELIRLIEKQKHRTLVMWALDCAQEPLSRFEAKYPTEDRLRIVLEKCQSWARGDIKMPEARKAILAGHAVAKEINDKEIIAIAHAIGHAGSTIHVKNHALGLVFYELTAIVHREGLDQCEEVIKEKISYYYERLLYWQKNINKIKTTWAPFLLEDNQVKKKRRRNI